MKSCRIHLCVFTHSRDNLVCHVWLSVQMDDGRQWHPELTADWLPQIGCSSWKILTYANGGRGANLYLHLILVLRKFASVYQSYHQVFVFVFLFVFFKWQLILNSIPQTKTPVLPSWDSFKKLQICNFISQRTGQNAVWKLSPHINILCFMFQVWYFLLTFCWPWGQNI